MTTTLVGYPDDYGDSRTPCQSRRLERELRRAALCTEHERIRGTVQRIAAEDRIANLADVATFALDEEVRFLNHGMALAGTSAVKAELVASKLAILATADNRLLVRLAR
jgi:hypothetical protein